MSSVRLRTLHAVPAEVLSRRGEIRTLSNEKETAISACADGAALAEYVTGSAFNSWEPGTCRANSRTHIEPTPSEE